MPTFLEDKFNAKILLFALSTCAMCKRVKMLLNDLKVEYEYIDVDLLSRNEKDRAKTEMRKWDPRCPFPMLVVNNTKCVIGDEPEQIKKVLEK
jgi:glutaredoxin-like protein NrdH